MKSWQEFIQILKSKVHEWKLMEYVSKAWNAISQRFSWIGNKLRLRARFKNTKAYAKLMAMTPLRRRMIRFWSLASRPARPSRVMPS